MVNGGGSATEGPRDAPRTTCRMAQRTIVGTNLGSIRISRVGLTPAQERAHGAGVGKGGR